MGKRKKGERLGLFVTIRGKKERKERIRQGEGEKGIKQCVQKQFMKLWMNSFSNTCKQNDIYETHENFVHGWNLSQGHNYP